ncbi:MAG: hypothetical protein Q4C61_15300 [Lachnospiraceae bacterium]|nr:hypothetical protein [Lachnospiraceae bacterium]
MLKLMKYEFRKTMFSKMVLLVITALAEISYLIGVFFELDKFLAVGLVGLVMCAMIGIFYIGIDSLIVFHRDLNTKQSYMLFLTPKNSYQVLGAKVLENGVSIFLAGVFFAALAAIDTTIGVLHIGGIKEFLDMLDRFMISIRVDINVAPQDILMPFFAVLASWLMTVVTGYLAILLSATVLAGKKFSGFVSFIIFLVLGYISGKALDMLPSLSNHTAEFCMIIGASIVIVAIMYAVTGWIMERKLSV